MVGIGYIIFAGIGLIAFGILLLTREKRLKVIPEIITMIGIIALSIGLY